MIKLYHSLFVPLGQITHRGESGGSPVGDLWLFGDNSQIAFGDGSDIKLN